MINKTRCLFYEVGGQFFKSLEEAQKADLKKLLESLQKDRTTCTGDPKELDEAIADWLLANSTALVDCLTTTPRSRLRGRKTHGAERKPRSDIGKKRTPKNAAPATT